MVRNRASVEREPPIPLSNEAGSLRRLTSLVKKLRSQGIIERYDQVIQDQIKAGIVELLTGSATGQRHFYIPHKRSSGTRLSRDHQASSSLGRVSENIFWCPVLE